MNVSTCAQNRYERTRYTLVFSFFLTVLGLKAAAGSLLVAAFGT